MFRIRFPKIRGTILHLLLASLLAFSLMPRPQPARAFLDPISLGALAGLSEVVGGNVRSATATLGAEIRQTVDLVLGEIDSIIGAARAAYADALNTTINNFDAFTSSKLLEVQQLLFTLNELVSQNIDLVRDRLIEVLTAARRELQGAAADIQARLQSLIVVGGETAVYVIDRTLFTVVQIIALILLGIGVLIFVGLLFREKRPQGGALVFAVLLMLAFIAVFGAIALVPSVRAMALSTAGLGIEKQFEAVKNPKPELFFTDPSALVRGETRSLTVRGIHLRALGEPTVQIGTQSLPVSAADDKNIVVNTGMLSLANGDHTLIVRYGEAEGGRLVVRVNPPPTPPPPPADLSIRSLTLDPFMPVRGRAATATVIVQNTGGSAATNFIVRWEAVAGNAGTRRETRIASLAARASQTLTFSYTYPEVGNFDTLVQVDPDNAVRESNEGNNLLRRSLRVDLRRAQVRVVFDRFVVPHDANGLGGTNIEMIFDVNGQTAIRTFGNINDDQRGTDESINNNRPISLVLVRVLNENERLTICADGRRWHGTYSGPTGQVCIRNLSSTNDWSAGSLRNSPENDYGRFDVRWYFNYRVEVRWLN